MVRPWSVRRVHAARAGGGGGGVEGFSASSNHTVFPPGPSNESPSAHPPHSSETRSRMNSPRPSSASAAGGADRRGRWGQVSVTLTRSTGCVQRTRTEAGPLECWTELVASSEVNSSARSASSSRSCASSTARRVVRAMPGPRGSRGKASSYSQGSVKGRGWGLPGRTGSGSRGHLRVRRDGVRTFGPVALLVPCGGIAAFRVRCASASAGP